MGTPVATNVLKTHAKVFKAPVGTTLPAIDTVGVGGSWPAGWVEVGYTKSPLVLAYEAEEANIEVEEFLMPIDRKKIAEEARLEVTLAELTGEYLTWGMGGEVTTQAAGATTVGAELLEVGNEFTKEVSMWAFEGTRYDASDNALPVRFYIWRATSVLNGELEFTQKGDDYTGISLKIDALADPSKNGKWGKMERVTAPKTA